MKRRPLPPRPRRAVDRAALETEHHIIIRRRVTAAAIVAMVGLGALFVRLAELQVLQGGRLQTIAARQQLITIDLPPHRGRLLDRRGRPLAINEGVPSLYAVPSAIVDRARFAEQVAPALGVPPGEILHRLEAGKYFAWLARKINPNDAARIRALGLGDQIGFRPEDRRSYPNGRLAAQLLGFVGIDNQGLAGVELAYDRVLRGRAGQAVAAHDGLGRVLVETQRTVRAPDDGADLVLTIDQVIQHIAERELDAAMERTHARRGSAIVMDVSTGEILALAVRPTFDPNQGAQARPELWMNPTVSGVYEPGSTFKIFLASAALDSGLVSPNEKFFDQGFLRVPGNHIIRDAHGRKYGWQTMADIIRRSSNIGAAQIATKLGTAVFYEYIRAFGFGARLGIDVPGEVAGLVPPPAAWRGPGLQTIAFGQGISVTPLQLLTAATALANDGITVRPYLVRSFRDAQGRTTEVTAERPGRRAVRPATARAVLRMMEGVVENGTGVLARLDGYRVAGKTGTAQKPASGGGYDPTRFVASFLGIVPSDEPKLAILVVLDEPLGAYYGGEVAAPVFREIAAQTLWYLRIPPNEQLAGQGRGPGNTKTPAKPGDTGD